MPGTMIAFQPPFLTVQYPCLLRRVATAKLERSVVVWNVLPQGIRRCGNLLGHWAMATACSVVDAGCVKETVSPFTLLPLTHNFLYRPNI